MVSVDHRWERGEAWYVVRHEVEDKCITPLKRGRRAGGGGTDEAERGGAGRAKLPPPPPW